MSPRLTSASDFTNSLMAEWANPHSYTQILMESISTRIKVSDACKRGTKKHAGLMVRCSQTFGHVQQYC